MENLTEEERSNQATGYKATMSNPNVSKEAQEEAKKQFEALGGEKAFYGKQMDANEEKNPNQVAGGLKATINNPTDYVSDEAREEAKKKLAEMEKSGQIPA